VVRFPAVPSGKSRSLKMRKCRSVGWITVTQAWESQDSSKARASSTVSGLGKIEGLVLSRRNDSRTLHEKAMVSVPDSASSIQDLALS